ncbi:MAG: hypothetical protein K0M50_17565 [Prolixibacteraceae bacterium]|nr:hypothetical protein [Prolixibacteraceae bacterium]
MDKSSRFTQLGRLDRAIAANLDDIRSSFDVDASLVLDFIVFISQRMKTDLFGYTRFTLKDFCEATGRRRQELALKHPIFLDGKKKVPEIQGLRFESVFDYALIRMMHHNLVFTNVFQDKCGDKTVHMEAIRILSDVKMNFGRKSTEVKLYDVRVSPEIIDGFVRRYYTIDVNAYKLAGKGKGRENRQSLVIYLSVLRHVLHSRGLICTSVPIDILANQGGISREKTSFHLKEAINNILIYIRDKAFFPFTFHFEGYKGKSFQVSLTFQDTNLTSDLAREHNFYHKLISDLKDLFDYKYKGSHKNKTDGDPFQDWLISGADLDEKINILKKAYDKAFNIELNDVDAYNIYKNGFDKL